jgi:hypothetical protein
MRTRGCRRKRFSAGGRGMVGSFGRPCIDLLYTRTDGSENDFSDWTGQRKSYRLPPQLNPINLGLDLALHLGPQAACLPMVPGLGR